MDCALLRRILASGSLFVGWLSLLFSLAKLCTVSICPVYPLSCWSYFLCHCLFMLSIARRWHIRNLTWHFKEGG